MAENNVVVHVYSPRAGPKAIIRDLQSGFDQNRLSIMGKDYHAEKRVIGHGNAGDRLKVWCQFGDFYGGLSGLLLGSAFYSIADVGPVIVFGPLVRWIVTALEGAVTTGGLSAVGVGLHSMGVLKNNIISYEKALKSDKFIVVAHGAPNDRAKAESILESPGGVQLSPINRSDLRQRA